MNRSGLFLGVAIAASASAIASCSSGVGPKPTRAHPAGFRDVKDPACTRAELRRIGPTTPRTRVAPNPKQKGVLNTRKTAVNIELGTLLVVSVRRANTLYLATPGTNPLFRTVSGLGFRGIREDVLDAKGKTAVSV